MHTDTRYNIIINIYESQIGHKHDYQQSSILWDFHIMVYVTLRWQLIS